MTERKLTGRDSDYYLVDVPEPKRLKPYKAECEDIIEALEMSFQEGEAFKAIWRKAAARRGNGKPGASPLYDAQKVAHYGGRMQAMEDRRQRKEAPPATEGKPCDCLRCRAGLTTTGGRS